MKKLFLVATMAFTLAFTTAAFAASSTTTSTSSAGTITPDGVNGGW